MIKEYRKKETIKAEQFTADPKQVFKYDIFPDDNGSGFDYFFPTKEGDMKINKGDWIATGEDGEHWAIADDIFQRTYEKVKNNDD